MTLTQAINALHSGQSVRHENWAAGTFATEVYGDNTKVWDPELGPVSYDEFRKAYAVFPDNWYIH